jgi:hypothetical protein
MGLGRLRIAVAILAALTAVVAIGDAVRSSGGAAARSQPTPLALSTNSATRASAKRASPTSAVPRRQKIDIAYLRAQWLDAEDKIRAAGVAMSQQVQQAVATKNGPAIAAALNQEVAEVSAQDQRIAALPWPASIKADIDSFESSSAAALNQLRAAASNPFGYDAAPVNAAITAFNTTANVVRHDLGLPPD